jgi:hypothetical protein
LVILLAPMALALARTVQVAAGLRTSFSIPRLAHGPGRDRRGRCFHCDS